MKSKPTTLARITLQATTARRIPMSLLHVIRSTHIVSTGLWSRSSGSLTGTSNAHLHTTMHSTEQTSRRRPWCSNSASGLAVTPAKAKVLSNGPVARRISMMLLSRCMLSRSTLPTTIPPSPTPTATLLALILVLPCRTQPAIASPA